MCIWPCVQPKRLQDDSRVFTGTDAPSIKQLFECDDRDSHEIVAGSCRRWNESHLYTDGNQVLPRGIWKLPALQQLKEQVRREEEKVSVTIPEQLETLKRIRRGQLNKIKQSNKAALWERRRFTFNWAMRYTSQQAEFAGGESTSTFKSRFVRIEYPFMTI